MSWSDDLSEKILDRLFPDGPPDSDSKENESDDPPEWAKRILSALESDGSKSGATTPPRKASNSSGKTQEKDAPEKKKRKGWFED